MHRANNNQPLDLRMASKRNKPLNDKDMMDIYQEDKQVILGNRSNEDQYGNKIGVSHRNTDDEDIDVEAYNTVSDTYGKGICISRDSNEESTYSAIDLIE